MTSPAHTLYSIHNVQMSYLLLMFISYPCQNRRIAKCSLPEPQKLFLEITVLARLIAECLEIKIVSAVNQICRFASTMKKATVIPRNKTLQCSASNHETTKTALRLVKSIKFTALFGGARTLLYLIELSNTNTRDIMICYFCLLFLFFSFFSEVIHVSVSP